MERRHREEHFVARVGWLRAAVLAAHDGIVSTTSLIFLALPGAVAMAVTALVGKLFGAAIG